MNVNRDHNGDMKLDSEDHSISFSWNRQISTEDKKVESTNKMISDVVLVVLLVVVVVAVVNNTWQLVIWIENTFP